MTTTDNKALAERIEDRLRGLWSYTQEARTAYAGDHASGTFRRIGERIESILDALTREPSTPSAQVSGGGEGIHPDFARLNTIDELADAIVKNTTSDKDDPVLLADVRDCLIRAQQLAALSTPQARPERVTPEMREQLEANERLVERSAANSEARKQRREQARPDGGERECCRRSRESFGEPCHPTPAPDCPVCGCVADGKCLCPAPDVARLVEGLADEWRDTGRSLRMDAMDMPPSNQKTNLMRMGRFYVNRADELNAALTAAQQGATNGQE